MWGTEPTESPPPVPTNNLHCLLETVKKYEARKGDSQTQEKGLEFERYFETSAKSLGIEMRSKDHKSISRILSNLKPEILDKERV
jgi:hypothetical protein